MSENLTRRYSIKATTNLAFGLAAGAASYGLAHTTYKCGKMYISANSDSTSMADIAETAKETGHRAVSEKCQKKAAVKTTSTTVAPDYNEAVYIQCMENEHSPRAIMMVGVMAVFAGYYVFKALRRSVSYANLARKTSKNQNEDTAFRLLSDEEVKAEANADYHTENHRFNLTNGISSTATIQLQPNETAQSERGALMVKGSDIEMNTSGAGPHATSKAKNLLGRFASGEGLFSVTYTNKSDKAQPLMLTPQGSKQLTALNLDQGMNIFCDNGAFFASSSPVDVGLKTIKNLSFQTFSGQGLSFQRVTGLQNGTSVLLASDGQVTSLKLADGESLDIQKGSLFALTGNVTLQLKETSGAFNRIASGEKGFMTSVTGPGTVWVIATGSASPKREKKSSFLNILNPSS